MGRKPSKVGHDLGQSSAEGQLSLILQQTPQCQSLPRLILTQTRGLGFHSPHHPSSVQSH